MRRKKSTKAGYLPLPSLYLPEEEKKMKADKLLQRLLSSAKSDAFFHACNFLSRMQILGLYHHRFILTIPTVIKIDSRVASPFRSTSISICILKALNQIFLRPGMDLAHSSPRLGCVPKKSNRACVRVSGRGGERTGQTPGWNTHVPAIVTAITHYDTCSR